MKESRMNGGNDEGGLSARRRTCGTRQMKFVVSASSGWAAKCVEACK